jgi:hypothetical protein
VRVDEINGDTVVLADSKGNLYSTKINQLKNTNGNRFFGTKAKLVPLP